MVERVEISDHQPADDAVQPETVETSAEETVQQEEVQQTDRPEWLPDKFGSPEDLAKAYGQLEKKMSSRQAEEQGLLTQADFDQFSNEYNEKGGLSDKAYEDLAKRGLSKDLVDNYIKGQEFIQQQQLQEMYGIAGGEETYKQMTEWASETMDQDELDAFNEAVQGDIGVARLAIKGMYAQYRAAGGETKEPTLVQGGKSMNVGGYGSNYEMMQDMKDPRYKAGDSAFHAMVEKRLAKTNL